MGRFGKAEREFANLYLYYEEQPLCFIITVTGVEIVKFQVGKMRLANK